MSSTGYISSGASVNTSGYNASGSNSSGNVSHPNLHLAILNKRKNQPKIEIKLYDDGKVLRRVTITSPKTIDVQFAPIAEAFISLFNDSEVDTSSEFEFKYRTGQHSTPNPPTTTPVTNGAGSSDLFSTPESLERSPQAPFAQPSNTTVPLLPPGALEEVSEDSDTEEMEQDTPTESEYEPILDSLDVQDEPIKVFSSGIANTQTELCNPVTNAFKGLTFVLTCQIEKTNGELGAASFRKDEYVKCLSAGGGHVVETINNNDPASTILVSDCSCTTENYLHALLLGILVVKNTWIDHCTIMKLGYENCRPHNIHDSFLLNRGTCQLTGDMVGQTKENATFGLFDDQVIYLQGGPDFKKVWGKLIESGGGRSLKRWYKDSSLKPNLVVSDRSKKISKTCLEFGTPIVKEDWLIQSVVTGRLSAYQPFLF